MGFQSDQAAWNLNCGIEFLKQDAFIIDGVSFVCFSTMGIMTFMSRVFGELYLIFGGIHYI
jgi:hypothetical protein